MYRQQAEKPKNKKNHNSSIDKEKKTKKNEVL